MKKTNPDLFTVKSTEHFEDWYVAAGEVGKYDNLEKAINALIEEHNAIVRDNEVSELDKFISELGFGSEEEFGDCNYGWALYIENSNVLDQAGDGEMVFWMHISYDYVTKSKIIEDQKFDGDGINNGALETNEILLLKENLKKSRIRFRGK